MRLSAIFLSVAGLAVAGGSAYLARDYFEARYAQAQVPTGIEMIDVLVASREIPFGQPIEAHLLTTVSWPAGAAPAGAFTDRTLLLAEPGGLKRRAKRSIAAGEPILASKISDFGEKVTIVQTLGPNHRAMAIKVDAETAVGGFVTPGDFVDVVLTQGRGEELRAVTILQNIRVVGVDQDANEQTDSPEVARTVTVEVTPEQGQRLALAQKAGTLSLTLRTLQADGVEDTPLEAIRLSDVMRDVQEENLGVSRTVVVRRGNVAEEQALR